MADRQRLTAAAAGFAFSLLLLLVLVPSAAAADVDFQRTTFESGFPQSMRFQLEATSLRPVERVTLFYRVAGRRAVQTGEARIVSDLPLRAEVTVDLARRYVPPGTQLQFHWEIEDDRGQVARSQSYQTQLDDRRFAWRQSRAPNLELNWYQGENAWGQILLSIATRSLGSIARDTGVSLERPVRVYVYGDLEAFRAASYRGGLEWVGGTFYPQEGVILLYAPPNQQGADIAARAIPHELMHAVVHQVTDNPFADVPQWLNEGLASRSEPSFSSDQADALAKGLAEGKVRSLKAIGGAFPVDPQEALLAYGQSYSVVAFLQERYGRGRLTALLQAYREGVTHDEGLQRALGVDMVELDRQWRAWLAPWGLQKAMPFPNDVPTASAPGQQSRSVLDAVRGLAESVWGRLSQSSEGQPR